MAPIAKILSNSFIDGPGNRMVFFFQGCNLNCLYCHNPETQNLCSGCGACVNICPEGAIHKCHSSIKHEDAKCRNCDACLLYCPNHSSPKTRYFSPEELFQKAFRYRDFLHGITVSGGECTLYVDFLQEFFRLIKQNTELSILVDTNGLFETETFDKISELTNGFMVDLKAYCNKIHVALTGSSNLKVLENIRKMYDKKKLHEIRTVVVEGYNCHPEEILSIIQFIKEYVPGTRLKLIPFRPEGVRNKLSNQKAFDPVKFEELQRIVQSACSHTE